MRDSPAAVVCDGTTGNMVPAIADGATNRLAVDARLNDGAGNYATVQRDGAVRRLAVDVRQAGTNASTMINKQLTTSGGSAAISTVSGTAAAPVLFTYSPGAGASATITRLTLFLEGATYTQNGTVFMGAAALTNGIQIGATVSGATYVLATIRVNEDLFTYGNGTSIASASGGTLLGLSLGTVTFIQFVLPVVQPLTGAADNIFLAVRDNLNAIGNGLIYGRCTVQGYQT